jgi:serine kinase of HPr protein (carbohydrate metabolism regulator)
VTGGPRDRLSVHATACLAGDAGLLILGASGAGKSALALRLAADGLPDGRGGRVACQPVADDRVILTRTGRGLPVARPHPAIAGRVEVRGMGIMDTPSADSAVLRGIIDLLPAEDIARLPEDAALSAELLGVVLPRLALPRGAEAYPALVRAWPFFRQRMQHLMTN